MNNCFLFVLLYHTGPTNECRHGHDGSATDDGSTRHDGTAAKHDGTDAAAHVRSRKCRLHHSVGMNAKYECSIHHTSQFALGETS